MFVFLDLLEDDAFRCEADLKEQVDET